jgi:hypothetical protein
VLGSTCARVSANLDGDYDFPEVQEDLENAFKANGFAEADVTEQYSLSFVAPDTAKPDGTSQNGGCAQQARGFFDDGTGPAGGGGMG